MDIKTIRQIYNDIWAYHKKYFDMQNEETFLKTMISEKDVLLRKYYENPFATEMIFVVFKSLIESWKEKYTPPEQT